MNLLGDRQLESGRHRNRKEPDHNDREARSGIAGKGMPDADDAMLSFGGKACIWRAGKRI